MYEGTLTAPGFAVPSYYTPYPHKLSKESIESKDSLGALESGFSGSATDQTISHLVSMALFNEVPSVDKQNSVDTPNRVEPEHQTFRQQDQTISHLVSMALFNEVPSVDKQNSVETPNRVEPEHQTFRQQGMDVKDEKDSYALPAANLPNLSDLVSNVPSIKPERKTSRKRSTPTFSPGPQYIDVKALIEAKMNSDELSSPMEKKRIAEMDAIIRDFFQGDGGQDERIPTFKDQPDTSSEDQKGQPLLWRFIFKLLEYSGSNPSLVTWVNREEGEFQIVQPKPVALLWGLVKNNLGMNYEKLSRGLRHYYKTGILVPVRGRLLYKFSAKAKIWNLMKKSQHSTLQTHSTSPKPGTSKDMFGYMPIPNENTSHMDTNHFMDVLDVIGSLEPSTSSSSYDSSPEGFSGQQHSLMMLNESMDLH